MLSIPFKTYLSTLVNQFENYLTETIPQLPSYTKVLQEGMEYALLSGGKRLRPILLLTTMDIMNHDASHGYPFAKAMEYIHCYSLVHDDLPCMDDDDLRRGMPTTHIKFGEDMAVLVGDALLTHAFQSISDSKLLDQFSAETILKANFALASGSGIYGMVAGQCADIKADHSQTDSEMLSFIHHHKTGSLISTAIELGGILSNATNEELLALKEFGDNIGKSFQIRDDILDEIGNEEQLGKPVGSDQKNEKLTYPAIYGLEKSKLLAQEHYDKSMEGLKKLPYQTDRLKELADYIVKRNH
ncbi:MAG: geranylgeranyl diphosphate synthase type II [bacterium]|jgi:geranylgeranyl diphosphate synthase type II